MDCAVLFSHSTMISCFSCIGFIFKGCMETLYLWSRILGLQREQLTGAETIFKEFQDAATTVRLQCEKVRFNKSLCRLLADTYSRSLHSDFDFRYINECETILAELRRVMSCGEMLVKQWTDKDWWKSVISSSDSASIKERVVLHLKEFLFCFNIFRLIASNGVVPDGTSFIPLDLSALDVEEASRKDIESLFSTVEGYKRASSSRTDVRNLADYLLDKSSTSTSNREDLYSLEYEEVFLQRLVGRGSSGTVFECQFHGIMAAAKVFNTSDVISNVEVQKEAKLQARLRHPNVVQFIGYAVKGTQHIIVSELMSKDLHQYLEEKVKESVPGPPLLLLLAVDIMLQIAEAMKYLHENRVIHRDLKSPNVLINVVKNKESYISPSVQVKLTDFGTSKLKLNSSRFTTPMMGTTRWRAPEVSKFEERYTKAADVYSFALVFSEVLTGELPFYDVPRTKILERVLEGVRPALPSEEYCPAHLSEVIQKCWATQAEDRPTFPEICQILWHCKGKILSHLHPHSSPQRSEAQKRRTDSGDIGSNFTTGSSANDLHLIEHDDVHLEKECLGIGAFGSVFKCRFHGEMAAVKMFLTSNIDQVKAVENEVNLLVQLQHPNVVQFIGYAVKGREHFIVTELMNMDLRIYLHQNVFEGQARPPLPLLLAVDIMLQIAEAMDYLHKSGVMHRDLKANNVLINVSEKESYISSSVHVKLTDFGMSKLKLNDTRFTTKQVGKAQWRAPEVFDDEQNTEKYTKAADVYSFTMVFFEVLTGEIPFAKIRPHQIFLRVQLGDRPTLPPVDYCPGHLSAFINKCWATRPEDRPKFPEICQMLQECKGMILRDSSPHPALQNSEPHKHRNDGDHSRSILAMDDRENLFQGSGRMSNISRGAGVQGNKS